MNDKYCVITFQSVSFAIRFEKTIKKSNIEIKLIPVPRSISSSCGLCGRFNCKEKENILNICKKEKLEYEGVYEINKIF